MFKKILVANRGEIALRIIRTCKRLRVKTAAVYSDADIESRHVTEADEAYRIGKAEPADSYLNIPEIVKTAREARAEGIHPGYGFLAENPGLARAAEESRISFIGPRSKVLAEVANKLESKNIVREAGVPVIPGSRREIETADEAESEARKVGFPVLVKAVFGGGGRGMRIVRTSKELKGAIERASSESRTGFGRSELYLEKYMEEPRHIEVQILAGPRGRTVHLGERECSLQRRYQKILEETPSPVLTESDRKRLISYALKVARATHYENAGTFEFVRSREGEFYYLETNKRIQVEHLITELVTGVDIVEEQLRIASGDGLGLSQGEVDFSGCAVNCRINAEDAAHGFAPNPGRVREFSPPGGPGIRVDSALFNGCPVPEYYDSLIAKVACWGKNRLEAISRMKVALDELDIEGVKTTIPVHRMILENQPFIRGEYHTQLLDHLLAAWQPGITLGPAEAAGIYVALRRLIAMETTPVASTVSFPNRWRAGLPQEDRAKQALYVEGI